MPDLVVSAATRDVVYERRRQIVEEGWSVQHDAKVHDAGSLATAAACYALRASQHDYQPGGIPAPILWPWPDRYWKPKDRRRDLVRAGALIIAEIERLDLLSAATSKEPTS